MRKNVHFKIISRVLLLAMVIGCFDPWLLEVCAAKAETEVLFEEAAQNPISFDLELNIDDNPEENDPMASENFRDPEEFCGEEYTFDELEEMGIDFESNEKNLFFAPETYRAGGQDGFAQNEIRHGIDVSKWQGEMNWEKAKSKGVDFTFIRACYRTLDNGSFYDDPYVYKYIEGADNAGISIGLYCFSQAITVAEAEAEADRMVALANSRPGRIRLPLVMDYEYGAGHTGRLAAANFSKAQATTIIKAFCKRVEDNGYEAMVYASQSVLANDMNASEIVSAGYDIWVARYTQETLAESQGGFTEYETIKNATASYDGIFPGGDFEFWQFSSKGKGSEFGASSTFIDMDLWFFDGYSNLDMDVSATPTVSGKAYNVRLPGSQWYGAVDIIDENDKIWTMSPKLTDAQGAGADVRNDTHLYLEFDNNKPKPKQMKVKTWIYDNKEFIYELVYDLTYHGDTNSYSASLSYVNDFLFYLNSLPEGYNDHAVVDGEKNPEIVYYEPLNKCVMIMGRDYACDGKVHTIVLHKTDGSNRPLEKRTYNCQFDETTHSFRVDPVIIGDYSIKLTPPAGYVISGNSEFRPQIWLDGVAKDAITTGDGDWKIYMGSHQEGTKLPEIVTIYSYAPNNLNKPTGMTVYLLSYDDDYILAELTTFKDVFKSGGYSMKVTGNNGLRYRAGIKDSFKNELRDQGVDGFKLKEYGIVGITAKNYQEKPLVVNGEKTSTAKAFYYASSNKIKDIVYSRDTTNDICYFSAFYENMPVSAYKTDMVTRCYMKVEYKGKNYTIYSAPARKALYNLAEQVLAANEFAAGTPERAYVQSIIDDANAWGSTP